MKGKINHSIQAVCLNTQAEGIKAQLLAYNEGHVCVRKVKKFKQPETNTF